MGKPSKNDPNSRNKKQVVERTCEFCGSNKGVRPAKICGGKRRMAWVCSEDKCVRFK